MMDKAKRKGGINTAALAAMAEQSEQEKSFVSSATMIDKSSRNLGGRPRVAEEDKADKPMNVYFTESERKIVKAYCKHISFSALVKGLLKEKGIIE